MPRKGSTSSRKLNKAKGQGKLSPWLRRHIADRALPIAARSAIGPTVPPPIPDSGQRYLRDGNSRLARWVINHAGPAIAALRAARLPLTSGVSDFVLRKSTSVSTVWQRVLSLPWVQQRQKQSHSSIQTAYAAPDWQRTNDIGRRSQDLQPTGRVQMSPADEEEHLVNETIEAHPPVTKEPPPLMTSDPFAPPVMKREPLGTIDALPRPSGATAMSPGTKHMVDNLNSNKLTRTAPVTRAEHPVSVANEAYPAVIRNLLSPPTSADRLTGTTYAHTRPMPLITGQTAVPQQAEDSDVSKVPYVNQGGTTNHGVHQSKQLQNADRRQMEGGQENLSRVDGQGQHSHLTTQPLSQMLTPVTQRATLQRRPLEVRPHIISEAISERHASPIRPAYQPKEVRPEAESGTVTAEQAAMPFTAVTPAVRSSDESTAGNVHTPPAVTSSERSATLQSKVLPDLLYSVNKPAIANEVAKRLDRLTLQRTANEPDGPAPGLPLSKEVSPSEGSRVPAYRAAPQPAPEVDRASTRETPISQSTRRRDVPNLETGAGGLDRSPAGGFAETLLSYRHPPSVTGSVVRPLPMIKSTSRTMTMPSQQLFKAAANVPISDKSENYGFPQSREYVPSSPTYKYARQPAPVLPATRQARPEANSGVAYSGELFRYTSPDIPEPSYPRNHNGLELALAPVSRAPETGSAAQATAPESQAEKSGEGKAAPDIRALAREVYPFIKRMIMIERDRHPTWY